MLFNVDNRFKEDFRSQVSVFTALKPTTSSGMLRAVVTYTTLHHKFHHKKHKGRYCQEGISKEKTRERLIESLSTWISSKVDFKKLLLLNMEGEKTLTLIAKRKWN